MTNPTLRYLPRHLVFRAIARVVVAAQVFLGIPLQTAFAAEGAKKAEPKAEAPAAKPAPPAGLKLSAEPSDAEIGGSGVFEEPLAPVGAARAPGENRALAQTLAAYARERDTAVLEAFLKAQPKSAWRVGVLTNLGLQYKRGAYWSKALVALEDAWRLGKGEENPRGKAVVDRALGELVTLQKGLGKMEALEALLAGVSERPVNGPAGTKLDEARRSLAGMKADPAEVFRCGPKALDRILRYDMQVGYARNPVICSTRPTSKGTSLAQLEGVAEGAQLNLVMARRDGATEIPVPSVVHWKESHYSAVVGREGDRYLVGDIALGSDVWVSRAAIDAEGSGYFLIPTGDMPKGWRSVSEEEGSRVWGRGYPGGELPGFGPNEPKHGSSCNSGPMAVPTVHLMSTNLHVVDTPVSHNPSVGPQVPFTVIYNSQDDQFPQGPPDFSNLGPRWNHGFLSWVREEGSSNVTVYPRGAGVEKHTADGGGVFPIHPQSGVRMVKVGNAWERHLPDGGKEVFALPRLDGRYFLTQIIDAQGNMLQLNWTTITQGIKLDSLQDAQGQTTTLTYGLGDAAPLKITKVTDPSGRTATFQYDEAGYLIKITDIIGLASEFTYGQNDFMTALETPYGRWGFRAGKINSDQDAWDRWFEMTDPTGARSRLEYIVPHHNRASLENITGQVPVGFEAVNGKLDVAITAVWDERAIAEEESRTGTWDTATWDYSKAHRIVWAWAPDARTAPVKRVEKAPLENMVWYLYEGQTDTPPPEPGGNWTLASLWHARTWQPVKVGRVLSDGASQIRDYAYNAVGMKIWEKDPKGRETMYVYGTGTVPDADPATGTGIDLLEVRQKNGANWETQAKYERDALHRVTKTTDASGQVTTYKYDGRGRLTDVVAPEPDPANTTPEPSRTTTYQYNPDTGVPAGSAGRLRRVLGPRTAEGQPVTTYEYDSEGRMWRVTSPDGYVVTTDYDAADRPVKVTYPDGTYEETVYNRLQAERRRDRMGRWTITNHDAQGRVVSVRDPQGRVVTQEWCKCGSLDKLVDANGNPTTWERDIQGRVTKAIRANGTATTYTYDVATGRLWKVQDPKDQVKVYEYEQDDARKAIRYQDTLGNHIANTPDVTFTYETAYPRLGSMTDGTGTTIYAYNPITTPPVLGAGGLASTDGPLPNDTVSYTYDGLGRLRTRSLNGTANETSFTFDPYGRIRTQTSLLGTFTFGYEGVAGRLKSLSYPNGQTSTYAYLDVQNDLRLQEIHHKKPSGATLSRFTYAYDKAGNIVTWGQQRDTEPLQTWTYGYDLVDQLTSARVDATPLPTPSRYAYAYDPAGNRTVEQKDDAPLTFTYDNMNRLTAHAPGGSIVFRGTVNEPAQVTLSTTTGTRPATTTPTTSPDVEFKGQAPLPQQSGQTEVTVTATDYDNPTPQTTTQRYNINVSGTSKAYLYDANGNLTFDGTRTYEWDAENRLLKVTEGTTILASFTYDGTGRRATKTTGGVTYTFVYDAEDVVEQRQNGATAFKYFHGPGIDNLLARQSSTGAVRYFVADHLGSIVQVTNVAGTQVVTRTYDPWGALTNSSTGSGYAFTGREWDNEAGLYYYRARYYDPTVGRFVSEDPLPGSSVDSYEYVRNNPLSLSDPSGLRPGDKFWTADDAVIDTLQWIADHKYEYKWDAWEWGGNVCEDADHCFSCSPPVTDHERTFVDPRKSPCARGTNQVAWYHTHTTDSLPGFSPQDRNWSRLHGPGYALQTADGKVLKYVWARAKTSYDIIGQVRMPK